MDKRDVRHLTTRVQEVLDTAPYWTYTLQPLKDQGEAVTKHAITLDAAHVLSGVLDKADDFEANYYMHLGLDILFLTKGRPSYQLLIYPSMEAMFYA
jgi:hypothetical protein